MTSGLKLFEDSSTDLDIAHNLGDLCFALLNLHA